MLELPDRLFMFNEQSVSSLICFRIAMQRLKIAGKASQRMLTGSVALKGPRGISSKLLFVLQQPRSEHFVRTALGFECNRRLECSQDRLLFKTRIDNMINVIVIHLTYGQGSSLCADSQGCCFAE